MVRTNDFIKCLKKIWPEKKQELENQQDIFVFFCKIMEALRPLVFKKDTNEIISMDTISLPIGNDNNTLKTALTNHFKNSTAATPENFSSSILVIQLERFNAEGESKTDQKFQFDVDLNLQTYKRNIPNSEYKLYSVIGKKKI